jgi:ribose transport system permease protein
VHDEATDQPVPKRGALAPAGWSAGSAGASLGHRIAGVREAGLLLIIVVVSVALTLLTPSFLTWGNLVTTLAGLSLDAIVVVGMTIALISGGFDLSVGAVFACAGIVAVGLMIAEVPIPIAILAALISGAAWGSLNGFLITRVGVNPFITTLGTMGMARGVVLVLTEGRVLAPVPNGFKLLGQAQIGPANHGVPIIVFFGLATILVGDVLLRNSVFLRQVYYVGGNERAARLSGLPVDRIKFLVYLLSGLLAALAGVIAAARFGSGSPLAGTGMELRLIAAAVIGGASLAGGEGTILGALLGLILLALVSDALILLNVNVYWQQLVTGAILVAAVTFDVLARRRRG